MPTRPQRFKPAHQRTRMENNREYDTRRAALPYRGWYGTVRWKAIRQAQLDYQPLCEMCLADEIVTEARVCDHVEPHRGDEVRFWSGPFQSLCEHHHNSAKQREELNP